MPVSNLSPYRSLNIPRLFSDFFRYPDDFSLMLRDQDIRVDEYREGDQLVIRAEAPGIDPVKDVQLTLDNGYLYMQIERHKETKVSDKDYLQEEMQYGSFARTLELPAGCSEKDVKATYKDGILEVRIPVNKEAGKKIAITVGK